LFAGGLATPQAGHSAWRRAPHSPQNFTPCGFSCAHWGQRIGTLRLLERRASGQASAPSPRPSRSGRTPPTKAARLRKKARSAL